MQKIRSFIQVFEDLMILTDKEVFGKENVITYGELLLLCKIMSLSNNDSPCTASNNYFSNLLHITERSVQRYLETLKKLNYIKVFEQKQGMKTTTRSIWVQYDKIKEVTKTKQDTTELSSAQIGHDISCQTTRQPLYEDTTDMTEDTTTVVKGHDKTVTQIREEKRVKENNKREEKKDSNTIQELMKQYKKGIRIKNETIDKYTINLKDEDVNIVKDLLEQYIKQNNRPTNALDFTKMLKYITEHIEEEKEYKRKQEQEQKRLERNNGYTLEKVNEMYYLMKNNMVEYEFDGQEMIEIRNICSEENLTNEQRCLLYIKQNPSIQRFIV